jgi:hypothetical protein
MLLSAGQLASLRATAESAITTNADIIAYHDTTNAIGELIYDGEYILENYPARLQIFRGRNITIDAGKVIDKCEYRVYLPAAAILEGMQAIRIGTDPEGIKYLPICNNIEDPYRILTIVELKEERE